MSTAIVTLLCQLIPGALFQVQAKLGELDEQQTIDGESCRELPNLPELLFRLPPTKPRRKCCISKFIAIILFFS